MKRKDDNLEKLINDIEKCLPQVIEKKNEEETFQLWDDPVIQKDLKGNIGAFFIRTLLSKLSINEHHVFKWRLENKYRQYQILNHYAPDCMPESIGLSELLDEVHGIQKIADLCNQDFFIKATLGHRTGDSQNFDRTKELEAILSNNYYGTDGTEQWILQRKLNIDTEFRIHSFGKDVIPGLTLTFNGRKYTLSHKAEQFLKYLLQALPDTILIGTLIGWDIAITNNNEFYVIEANITGFHPEFYPGFQTSGYFGSPRIGSAMCAWINNYFKIHYHIYIDSIEFGMIMNNQFYEEFLFYNSIFNRDYLDVMNGRTKHAPNIVITYLNGNYNHYLIKLIEFFIQIDFADTYYLITKEADVDEITDFLSPVNSVMILFESKLCPKNEYINFNQLTYAERRSICCEKVLSLTGEQSYFII